MPFCLNEIVKLKQKTMKIFLLIILWIAVAKVFLWIGSKIFNDKNKFYE